MVTASAYRNLTFWILSITLRRSRISASSFIRCCCPAQKVRLLCIARDTLLFADRRILRQSEEVAVGTRLFPSPCESILLLHSFLPLHLTLFCSLFPPAFIRLLPSGSPLSLSLLCLLSLSHPPVEEEQSRRHSGSSCQGHAADYAETKPGSMLRWKGWMRKHIGKGSKAHYLPRSRVISKYTQNKSPPET